MKAINEAIDKKGEKDENFEAKTAKKLLALAPTEKYNEVQNLGDKANKYVQLAPGLRETRLAVLTGNVVVQISVDISDDDSEDLSAAKRIAQSVIDLCDKYPLFLMHGYLSHKSMLFNEYLSDIDDSNIFEELWISSFERCMNCVYQTNMR